ncbi:SMI1/KNR4 family protein [Bacillus sp. FJAT-50079]|uniref:SMI1/KNR4 family protein n=1 Tax=Bacillus sp. FJAT-50079 TaxID=2833577 RepID=UPI001BCA2388|nr:SMI1/KNR4 family protein [Bacillus sp. FJAT-50079]MBS4207366.1 SMI1/KNR4 family protein [Bacillus sp. FJAT-50079]
MKKEGRLVKQTLHSLKKRLEDNYQIIELQNEQGHVFKATCTFTPPASEKDIIYFEKETGFILPEDYKAFLQISNGCRLFDDVQFGGEIELFSLEKIIELNQDYDPYEGCFVIAYIYQDHIVIHSNLYSQNSRNYLFWKSHIDQLKEAIPLQMNFELWLERFIISQGVKFWWWPIYTAENAYYS